MVVSKRRADLKLLQKSWFSYTDTDTCEIVIWKVFSQEYKNMVLRWALSRKLAGWDMTREPDLDSDEMI